MIEEKKASNPKIASGSSCLVISHALGVWFGNGCGGGI